MHRASDDTDSRCFLAGCYDAGRASMHDSDLFAIERQEQRPIRRIGPFGF